jgi:hypothetical protein
VFVQKGCEALLEGFTIAGMAVERRVEYWMNKEVAHEGTGFS